MFDNKPVKNTLPGAAAVKRRALAPVLLALDQVERPLRAPQDAAQSAGALVTQPRHFSRGEQIKRTLEVAEALTQLLLTAQRADLGAIPNTALFGMFEGEAAVHQAAGLISVQCDCRITDAMALFAARAFADDLSGTGLANWLIRGDASIL